MKLTEEEIKSNLEDLSGWKREGDSIERTFEFSDFMQSIEFVNKIASIAEDMQHHPDILIQYSKVRLTLTSHDEGGLTKKDFVLAEKIEFIHEDRN